MSALFRREFRELAPLGAVLAGASALAWGSQAKLGDYLIRNGEGFELMAMAGVLAGVLLGMAPFELERLSGTRAYLLHRATTARWVAVSRIAAAGSWAAIVLGVSFLAGPVAHLGPAYDVEGFVGGIFSGLALAAGMVLPGLGLGAVAGTLVGGRMLRWTSAFGGALALAVWGGRLSTAHVLDSAAGRAPFVAFVVLSGLALSAVAVERFERWARGRSGSRPMVVLTASSLVLAIAGLPWFLFVSVVQAHARQLALVENENWTVTPDRTLRRRPSQRWDVFRQWTNWNSYERLEKDERTLFDCVYGGHSEQTQPLGRRSPAWSSTGWMLGRPRSELHSTPRPQSSVWFDFGLDRIVVEYLSGDSELRLAALAPADGAPRFDRLPEFYTLLRVDPGSGDPSFLLVDPDSKEISSLSIQDSGPMLASVELPEGETFVDLTIRNSVRVRCEARSEMWESEWVVVGRHGEYVLCSGEFVGIESSEPSPGSERLPISVRISERDGLRYVATLEDEQRNEVIGRSEHGPRTDREHVAAFVAGSATMLRSPLGSLASHLLVSEPSQGAVAPATSLWIDPLVLGGRRSWLLLLHLGLGAGLAWRVRRRLGGKAWGWSLAVFLLGLVAWLVCRLLEPRRAPTPEAARPAPLPRWAPIVDRATA